MHLPRFCFARAWYAILESFKLINFNLENSSPECYAGQFSWDLRWLALMVLFVGASAVLALVVQAARWCCGGRPVNRFAVHFFTDWEFRVAGTYRFESADLRSFRS